jgi:hypothetical protein
VTWRPPEQDPCTDPCCTGGLKRPFDELGGVGSTDREIAPVREQRTCTPEDPCRFCGPVEFWDRDPAPVEEPPEPGHEKARPLQREPGGVSDQHTAPVEPPPEPASRYVWDDHHREPGPEEEPPLGYRHIRNARKDRT